MTVVFNKERERGKRKQLRNSIPESEIILWSRLKRRQFFGYRFRRQYGIGRYVVDFYCASEKYDRERTAYIEALGLRIIRFTNSEIRHNLLGVLEKIRIEIERK